mmetsp:Transcript_41149/g.81207  ORF Transcript_41149/g.81207 Transcript_41149/m.81207 type:complete len:98 (-) Transcript_41149:727-1020(-)
MGASSAWDKQHHGGELAGLPNKVRLDKRMCTLYLFTKRYVQFARKQSFALCRSASDFRPFELWSIGQHAARDGCTIAVVFATAATSHDQTAAGTAED